MDCAFELENKFFRNADPLRWSGHWKSARNGRNSTFNFTKTPTVSEIPMQYVHNQGYEIKNKMYFNIVYLYVLFICFIFAVKIVSNMCKHPLCTRVTRNKKGSVNFYFHQVHYWFTPPTLSPQISIRTLLKSTMLKLFQCKIFRFYQGRDI